jgi:hypothetical protein
MRLTIGLKESSPDSMGLDEELLLLKVDGAKVEVVDLLSSSAGALTPLIDFLC